MRQLGPELDCQNGQNWSRTKRHITYIYTYKYQYILIFSNPPVLGEAGLTKAGLECLFLCLVYEYPETLIGFPPLPEVELFCCPSIYLPKCPFSCCANKICVWCSACVCARFVVRSFCAHDVKTKKCEFKPQNKQNQLLPNHLRHYALQTHKWHNSSVQVVGC